MSYMAPVERRNFRRGGQRPIVGAEQRDRWKDRSLVGMFCKEQLVTVAAQDAMSDQIGDGPVDGPIVDIPDRSQLATRGKPRRYGHAALDDVLLKPPDDGSSGQLCMGGHALPLYTLESPVSAIFAVFDAIICRKNGEGAHLP